MQLLRVHTAGTSFKLVAEVKCPINSSRDYHRTSLLVLLENIIFAYLGLFTSMRHMGTATLYQIQMSCEIQVTRAWHEFTLSFITRLFYESSDI